MRSASIALFGLTAVGLFLSGCAAVATVKETVGGPHLTDISSPAIQASMAPSPPTIVSSMARVEPSAAIQPVTASANSLWRPGARAFFLDQRASRPGDILTVLISIDDSAQMSNSTNSSRANETKGQISHFLGLEQQLGKFFPNGYDPANAIDQSGNTSSQGAGSISRQEKISLSVAAVVTGVLPNGNLIIQGSQQVKTNNELRDLTVTGIVRPQDISSSNTILHTQIAEARIYYGGKGDVSRVQKTPPAQALMETFSPF
jgi:flagellar L-ring protein precursor FlgH